MQIYRTVGFLWRFPLKIFFISNHLGFKQKNVIIQRDRLGYGLTVSGDNPVYVLSVREGGAAHRAGININDQIIKVSCENERISTNQSWENEFIINMIF